MPGRSNSALPDLSWVPPEDRFDWIQLKSGEWLKGKIKAMQERKLELDSEELEMLTFEWRAIRQVRSPHINDLLYGEQAVASGPIDVRWLRTIKQKNRMQQLLVIESREE